MKRTRKIIGQTVPERIFLSKPAFRDRHHELLKSSRNLPYNPDFAPDSTGKTSPRDKKNALFIPVTGIP
jgi:hypothetical protein